MNLHQQFVKLASQRNKITHELLALIPEIDKQRIWQKQGYQSIYHYAQAIAGLSINVVQKRIRLEKHLEDKPHLKEAIKTQGVHKVAMIATLATTENEEQLAAFVTNAGKSAVQEYAKEVRKNGENKKCHAQQSMTIELDDEMQRLFLKLKQKYGTKISNKEALRRILKEKVTTKKVSPGTRTQRSEVLDRSGVLKKSRYISAKKRHSLPDTCTYPGCNRPKEILHHSDRFATSHSHDSILPLCKIHHEFAHNGKIANEQKPPETWTLTNTELKPEDLLYRKHRQERCFERAAEPSPKQLHPSQTSRFLV